MRKETLQACLVMATLLAISAATASAQQVVHALTGVVTAINPNTQTIHVVPDDGSEGLFDILKKKDTPLEFQKDVKAAATPADAFTKTQSHCIIFYFGDDEVRTTVALRDLGPGPFVKTTGTFVKLDRHTHTLIIRNASGEQTFQIDPKAVGDASQGVVPGDKFSADKGAQIRVIATTSNGVQTALFIRALTL